VLLSPTGASPTDLGTTFKSRSRATLVGPRTELLYEVRLREVPMPMKPATTEAKREGARWIGGLFQFLALVTLVGTAIGGIKISSVDSQIGLSNVHDPLMWIVLMGGIIAAAVFAGFGYTLGILCAIYDRQEWRHGAVSLDRGNSPNRGSGSESKIAPRTVWDEIVEREEHSGTTSSRAATTDLSPTRGEEIREANGPSKVAASTPGGGSGLWAWLTKERHLAK